jgi:LysR family transcriptional regulator for bpeEF and oprC
VLKQIDCLVLPNNDPAMDRLVAMQTFVRVVETGSFTRAAQSLGLGKASVSQQVAQLETQLRVRLLHRTTRQLRLTDDGAAYYERARQLIEDFDELEASLPSAARRPQGRLRIDVGAAFGVHFLIPALPDFFRRYPDIQLRIGSTDRPIDLLAEGVDCVIRGGDVHDEALIGRPLALLSVFTLASAAYLRRNGTPRNPEALREHALIGFFSQRDGRTFPYDFERDGERIEIDGPFAASFNDANNFLAAGLSGLGVFQTVVTPYIEAELAAGKLRRILKDWAVESLRQTILYPSRRHQPARLRVFVDWAIERFGEAT